MNIKRLREITFNHETALALLDVAEASARLAIRTNRVTSYWRHGNKNFIDDVAFMRLNESQIELEEKLKKLEEVGGE